MGTDIHGRIQARRGKDQPWSDEGEIERERRYLIFAILAGVRNGSGFAGVYTHEAIEPISKPRGLPQDADYTIKQWINGNLQCDMECDYGDHSQSWLLLSEILDWPHWDEGLQRGGVVERGEYERLQREGGKPKAWCGGVTGRDVVMATETNKPEGWTHIEITWASGTLREQVNPYWEWFKYLEAKHGRDNCRLVFGFDS